MCGLQYSVLYYYTNTCCLQKGSAASSHHRGGTVSHELPTGRVTKPSTLLTNGCVADARISIRRSWVMGIGTNLFSVCFFKFWQRDRCHAGTFQERQHCQNSFCSLRSDFSKRGKMQTHGMQANGDALSFSCTHHRSNVTVTNFLPRMSREGSVISLGAIRCLPTRNCSMPC